VGKGVEGRVCPQWGPGRGQGAGVEEGRGQGGLGGI
jgi:hypothetical protein